VFEWKDPKGPPKMRAPTPQAAVGSSPSPVNGATSAPPCAAGRLAAARLALPCPARCGRPAFPPAEIGFLRMPKNVVPLCLFLFLLLECQAIAPPLPPTAIYLLKPYGVFFWCKTLCGVLFMRQRQPVVAPPTMPCP
jgi:hypothetical protein